MANPRKVQTEIDKLMKKVKEGMDVYEGVFEKVQSAPDKMQKEKFEAELKKEIKKLQRLRESIKMLVANPEVKDKKLLETTRREIEIKMEAFKVCERETKTKAFSKEGLAAAKNDPTLRAKMKTVNWINDAIDQLQDQIDQLEFDIENEVPNSLPTRRGQKGDPREARMARNNHHILKLEAILRVLEIGDLEPEQVDEIEGDVQAYVAGLDDPSYEEDEEMDMYEIFDLPEGMVQNITAGGAASDSDEEATSPTKKPAAAPAVAEVTTPPQKVAPKPAVKKAAEAPAPAKVVPAPASVAAKQSTPGGVTITQPAPSVAAKSTTASPLTAASQKTPVTPVVAKTTVISPQTQGKSMAAIVAGHRASEEAAKAQPPANLGTKTLPPAKDFSKFTSPQAAPPAADENGLIDEDADENNDDTFGDDAMDGVTPGAGSLADMASMTNKMGMGMGGGDWAKPLPPTVSGTQQPGAKAVPAAVPSVPAAAQPSAAQVVQRSNAAAAPVAAPFSQPAPTKTVPQAAPAVPPPSFAGAAAAPSNIATAAPAVSPAQGVNLPPSADVIQRMLSMSLRNLPHTSDCERPKAYAPPNPYNTPEFYPQTVHPAFSNSETFSKFDPDTLFFIFYYQQTTYQQYLAAKELKKGSWRFHKKFQTWFQRHDRPKLTTDEFEQGTYIYFDFENGWCQRIKADFIFKYVHLEDQL